jgi:hypothetical protein
MIIRKIVTGVMLLWSTTLSLHCAAADDTTIFSLGGSACGDWTRSIRGSPVAAAQVRAWMLGYLSGLASSGALPPNILDKTSPTAALAWIDNYCGTHPLEGMGGAGTLLMLKIANIGRPSK